MVGTMGAYNNSGLRPQKRISILKLLRDYPDFAPAGVSTGSNVDELGAWRAQSRDWARQLECARRKAIAGHFAAVALDAMAAELGIGVEVEQRLPDLAAHLDGHGLKLARSIGQKASGLPLDEALHFTTSLYPALLSDEVRSELGAFYTPPSLSGRLVDLATEHGVDWATARVLDPAAGAGAFLIQAARRMLREMEGVEPALQLRQLASRLHGFEIDSNAALLAQAALEIQLADLVASAGHDAPEFVRVCDSLDEEPTEHFDLVIGNPPYGRVSLTSEQRTRYARSLHGHANLYGVFTDLAVRWTKPGGLIAYLTPTSFLAGRYYSSLRRMLSNEAPPLSLDFVHARKGVFEDVLQETLLAVYKKAARRNRIQIHYLHVTSSVEAAVVKNGTVGLPADSNAPWLAPRTADHGQLIAAAETMPSRLKDWGYGVSTGPLVWNRFKDQLTRDKQGASILPLVWAECVLPQGTFEFRARKKHHTPYFRLKPGDEWLVVKEPCVLVQRTTAKEQARRLIAAELPIQFLRSSGGVVIENHLNMVKAIRPDPVESAVVSAFLNSHVIDQLFRCMNGSVAVSAFELAALPLPDQNDLEELRYLVATGAEQHQIDAECARLYRKADA